MKTKLLVKNLHLRIIWLKKLFKLSEMKTIIDKTHKNKLYSL